MRLVTLIACVMLLALPPISTAAPPQKKDYLTDAEADKIRDANTNSDRIRLFVSFSALRIEKLKYEFAHPSDAVNRDERINDLINGYSGCLDDAADLIDLGLEKNEDIREGIKEMQARAPAFLSYLKELTAKGGEADNYKDNLQDAVEATNDALKSAEEASKQIAPPPVRRDPG